MKKVLITGGASGIGKACAELFLKNGYDTFITYNNTLPGSALDGITAVKCDVSREGDILSLFDTVGSIDVVVNNAAVSTVGVINNMTAEAFDELMAVNSRGVYLVCREAIRDMVKRKSGAVINISSMWGQIGGSCETAYSMSKAGVIGLTKALAMETAPSGITVNCVAPGIIDTGMNKQFDLNELAAEVPLGRVGCAADVARAVLFFAESPYITAQVLGVNGGIC